jgi:SanA protein
MERMRRVIAFVLALALLGGASALAIMGWVQWRYDRLVLTDVAAAPHAPVAIVFGAGIAQSGQLSPMLRDRMDTAIALYRSGVVRKLLVSGDNRFADYDEPGRMYDYAVARGIPAKDVVRDYAGRRTYDTCYRAKAIFGVEQALLVSQRFHLARAIFTCRALGVDSVGVSADINVYRSTSYSRLREALASVAAWWDVNVLHPLPVLGQREDIGL